MALGATTAITQLSDMTRLLATEYDVTTFIETLREKLVVQPLARHNEIPRHSGDTIRWHIFNNPSAVTTVRTDGVDPTNSQALTSTIVTDDIEIFGHYFEISEEVAIMTLNGTRQAFIDAAAHQAALTVDTVALVALAGATNINNAGTAMKAEDLRTAASELEANNAMRHPKTPGGNFFCAVMSSEAAYDLIGEGAPTWYQAKAQAFEDNLTSPLQDTPASSAVHNYIVKISTNIQRNTGVSPDDDQNYLLAKDGLGSTSMESNVLNPEVLIVPPTPSLATPLGMRGTIGWKVRYASSILDNNRLVEILSDATGVG